VKAHYRRVLIKLSGGQLAGESGFGISPAVIGRIAGELREVHQLGTSAAYMGMLASVINALALQDALEKTGLATRVLTALEMRSVAEPYIRRRAVRHLEKGRVVVFAGGTGNPYFSTDTAAVLRAAEVDAEIILMAKQGVDGVYDDDPKSNPKARRYDRLHYDEAIQKNLRVMDQTAIALCRENDLPIIVFDMNTPGNICKVAAGKDVGTRVGS